MSLAVHQTWLFITTTVLIFCSLLMLIFRRSIPGVFRYNISFLSLFGIESRSGSWIQYLFSWLIGTCMATVVFTLLINMIENLILIAGLSGIALDPAILPLAIGSIIISVIFISAALIPVLGVPFTPPSALGVLILLQLYGIPYNTFFYLSSLFSVFIYFAAIAIGFVGVFLALYLLLRTYLVPPLLRRYRRRTELSSPQPNITKDPNER